MKAIHWSYNDRYLGPFTYARERHYRTFTVMIGSGDDDDYLGCWIRMSMFGHTLICRVPAMIKPSRSWRPITTEPTRSQIIAQGREPGYWETYRREYGFSFAQRAVHIHYGEQTHDSTTDKSKCYFLPWRSSRCIRRTLLDSEGNIFANIHQGSWRGLSDEDRRHRWAVEDLLKDACPVTRFAFDDFDGERIIATARIEEVEYALGEGWFKWLSWFWPNRTYRSLDLRFSAEVGRRKGSWKGGTIGHSCKISPGEHVQEAFERYCTKEGLTFVRDAMESGA